MTQSPAAPTIQLNAHEALVLFEWVSRFTDEDSLTIADPAERAALWSLCAALESVLVEPLSPDYEALLEEARQRVREQAGL